MRVAHYLNQFFGGIWCRRARRRSFEIRDGAVGPGKLLESALGDERSRRVTFVCGDNYAVEHQDELTAAVLAKLRTANIDLFHLPAPASTPVVTAWLPVLSAALSRTN
jgi:glycine reductase